jgi:membrane protease YdiL (CAAX protease family)
MFEEMLLRGVIQNIAFLLLQNEWLAIVISTVIFAFFHPQYFSKPIMVVNFIIMGSCLAGRINGIIVPAKVPMISVITNVLPTTSTKNGLPLQK